MRYKAFISYSHAADGKLAPKLHFALHRFARPWYALRAMRAFRDKTNLAANPRLWSSIEQALSDSEYFVLLASTQAAVSKWVYREIDFWLKNRSPDKLLIIVTDGDVIWDSATGDFDWTRTTALPPTLAKAFSEEPLYLDFRWAKTSEDLSLNNPAFRDKIADLAATLHGRPKDEMIGEDVREHRKTKRLAWSAAMALVILTLVSGGAAQQAWQQKNNAEQRKEQAVGLQLAAEAEAKRAEQPALLQESVAQAVRAMRQYPSIQAYETLRNGVALLPRPLARMEHEDNLTAIAFSPDGRLVATASYDRTVQISEASSQPKRARVRIEHKGVVWALAFSPDGKYIATASWDGTTTVWEVDSGQHVLSLPRHHNAVIAVTFSPDHQFLAMASDDGEARIFELNTRRQTDPLTHGDRITCIAFSPDGKFLVTGSDDKTAKVWDPSTGREIRRMDHKTGVTAIAFGSDGTSLVTATRDGVAQVWQLPSGRKLSQPMKHGGVIWSVAFSPDGKYLATGSRDKTARVWQVASGTPIAQMNHEDFVWKVAFSPNGKYLTTASRDQTARVWEVLTGVERARMIHKRSVIDIAFSPDGKSVATASEDKNAQIWELPLGAAAPLERQLVETTHTGDVEVIALSADGKFLATGSRDTTAQVWDMTDGSEKRMAHKDNVIGVAFSPDGRFLATASWDRTVRVWDLTTAGLKTLPHTSDLEAIAFSLDGRWLATASEDKTVQIWDPTSGRPFMSSLKYEGGVIRALTFSPDGKYLVGTGEGKATMMWEVLSGRRMPGMIHDGNGTAVAFTLDGQYWATASDDKNNIVEIRKMSSGSQVARIGQKDFVKAMAFSTDGRLLATAGWDGIRVWEVKTGREIAKVRPGYDVTAMAFSWNQKYLVVLGADRIARRWSLLWPEDLIHEACMRLTVAKCEASAVTEPLRQSVPTLPASSAAITFPRGNVQQPITPAVHPSRTASRYQVEILSNNRLVPFTAMKEDGPGAISGDPKRSPVILEPGKYSFRVGRYEIATIDIQSSCTSHVAVDSRARDYVNRVNAMNGNLVNPNIADSPFPHWYNSRSLYDGPFGYGWEFESTLLRKQGGFTVLEVDGFMTKYQASNTGFHMSEGEAAFKSVIVEEGDRVIRYIKDDGYQKRYGRDVVMEVFDSQGRLRSVRYASGKADAMHNRDGRLHSISDQWSDNPMYTFERDSQHRQIIAVLDAAGRRFRYTYDGDRRSLVKITAPNGATTDYRYDDDFNLIGIRTADGNELVFEYDKKRDFLISLQAFGMDYHFKYGYETLDHSWTERTDNMGNLVRWDFHTDTQETLVTTVKCVDQNLSR